MSLTLLENAPATAYAPVSGPSALPGVVTDGENGAEVNSSLFGDNSAPASPSNPKPSFALRGQEGFREAWERMEREQPKPEQPKGEGNPFRRYLPLVAAAKAGEIAAPDAPGLRLSVCATVPDVNAFVLSSWASAGRLEAARKKLQAEMSLYEERWLEKEFKRLAVIESNLGRLEMWLAVAHAYWSGWGQAAFPASFPAESSASIPATKTEQTAVY